MIPLEVVDFSGAWASLWARASAGFTPQMQQMLMWGGVLLVVFAAWKWVWGKHKGKATGGIIWVLIIGTALVAPTAIIPAVLTLLDMLINFVISAVPTIHAAPAPSGKAG